MRKSARTLLISTGILSIGASVFTLASYILTKKLVKVAIDREMPKASAKSRYRISGVTPSDPNGKKIALAGQKLKNSNYETVEITGCDKAKLVGHIKRCENAKRIIIAVHGWRSSWNNDFGMIADFWHNNDCHVLYIEQRGHNESGGKYLGFGMIERYDCLDWAYWATENIDSSLPIYLAGISMGASTVLMTSSLNLPQNVCGIIADSGFTSAHDIWKHVTENNLHLSYKMVGFLADNMCKKKINMSTKDYSTKDALKETNVPILLIHGSHDKFVPVSMTYENYLATRSKKELLIVPGAGHGRSYLVDKDKYEKTVLDFWKCCEQKSSL